MSEHRELVHKLKNLAIIHTYLPLHERKNNYEKIDNLIKKLNEMRNK